MRESLKDRKNTFGTTRIFSSKKYIPTLLKNKIEDKILAAKNSPQEQTIKWTGTAGIESADKLQKELLKALNSASTLFLDLSEVEDIDLTGIQLILATQKEADSQKKEFFVKDNVPPAISEYVSGCGIDLNSLIQKTQTGAQ